MPDDPSFYILKSPHFPPAELMPLLLGRIVKNYASPFDNFTPQDPRKYLDSPCVECKSRNVSAVISSDEEGSLSTKLKGIAEFSTQSNATAATTFETNNVRSVRVTQHTKAFKKLIEDPVIEAEVRSWLTVGGKPAYLIVGVCIWENAKVKQETTTDEGAAGSVTVAAGTAAAAAASAGAAVPAWVNGIGDLVTDVKLKEQTVKTINADTDGNSIFAIECRNVYRILSSILKGFPVQMSDHGPRYPAARTLGEQKKKEEEEPAAEAAEKEAEGKIQPDFSDKLPWTADVKKLKTVEAEGLNFVFDE